MFSNLYLRADRDSWILKFRFVSLSLAEFPLSGNLLHIGPTLGPGPYAGGARGAAPRWCILIYTLNSNLDSQDNLCSQDPPPCPCGTKWSDRGSTAAVLVGWID